MTLKISTENQHFVVNIDTCNIKYYKLTGTIYPTYDFDSDLCYISDNDGVPISNVEDANVLYNFYITWRGCWDSRVYFPNDNEYFSEDIKEIYDTWKILEPKLINIIKEANPDYIHFD